MYLPTTISPILVYLLLVKITATNCNVLDELDEETLQSIIQLRANIQEKVSPLSPIRNYIDDDLYILQWLKANGFDLHDSEIHFVEHLTWRKHHNVDAVIEEDWTDFAKDFPAFIDTEDKRGRPVSEVWISNWNIRGAVLNGRGAKLLRWRIYLNEMQQKRLFETRQENGNVTGTVEIQDFHGFNIFHQGCPTCWPVLMKMFNVWAKHYGGIMEDVYLLNLGPQFYPIFKLSAKQFSTTAAPDALKPYQSKVEWQPIMDKVINREQRSERFGGTIKRKVY